MELDTLLTASEDSSDHPMFENEEFPPDIKGTFYLKIIYKIIALAIRNGSEKYTIGGFYFCLWTVDTDGRLG